MTVFNTFLKVLNKNKVLVIVYTVILLIFGASNMKTNENSMSFTPTKPSIAVFNYDKDNKITNNLIKYLKNNTKIIKLTDKEEIVKDSIFYEEISYAIYIPKNYGEDYINGLNPQIEVKTGNNAQTKFSEMILTKYLNIANIYLQSYKDETTLITKINETLDNETKITITSKLDTTSLTKTAFYYNFASYSFLACLIYVICIIMLTFNEERIKKRTVISSTNYKKHNRILLLGNMLYATVLWLFYVLLSFILMGKIMFSLHGLIFILNSFIFVISAATLAFFISTLISSKNAISGIMNVVSLGSSFLCGAFVPIKWLPNFVKAMGHIFPTYYYITNNNTLSTLEKFSFNNLKTIITNMSIMILFIIVFIILSNIVTRKKRSR